MELASLRVDTAHWGTAIVSNLSPINRLPNVSKKSMNYSFVGRVGLEPTTTEL